MEYLKDIWFFVIERKKLWLLPMILILLMLGFIIAFAGSSAVAPFIYSIF